jgi:hypothetical protein
LTWKSKVVGPMHPEFMMQLEDLGIRRAWWSWSTWVPGGWRGFSASDNTTPVYSWSKLAIRHTFVCPNHVIFHM